METLEKNTDSEDDTSDFEDGPYLFTADIMQQVEGSEYDDPVEEKDDALTLIESESRGDPGTVEDPVKAHLLDILAIFVKLWTPQVSGLDDA
ncbi:hypothetical protein JG687_00016364 [Phytophthora cactorum]|uniref:Uncharacterized protein n=1 Tax=Phytophthora cactorum TaxID=29920 RepID=A0A8T1TVE5_9STRA|nr:hypothetical protein JG687_00016364 [Phytophthora cactorum]